MQTHSSKNTSINKTKLPSIYNTFEFRPGSVVFDYGCGRYTEHLKAKVEAAGAEWYGYDLNWKPDGLDDLRNRDIDICICANVLNVIDDDEVLDNIIREVIDNSKHAVFQIYEGDGSGVGKSTQNGDSWQRNEKTISILDRIQKLGYNSFTNKGNFIYC